MGLSYPVGAVDGLTLHGGVPAGVHEDDVVGGSKVDANAPGPEADKKDWRPA